MKRYEEYTEREISNIVLYGGDRKVKLNKAIAEYLDMLPLSRMARNVIASTDYYSLADVFGGLHGTRQIEVMCRDILTF